MVAWGRVTELKKFVIVLCWWVVVVILFSFNNFSLYLLSSNKNNPKQRWSLYSIILVSEHREYAYLSPWTWNGRNTVFSILLFFYMDKGDILFVTSLKVLSPYPIYGIWSQQCLEQFGESSRDIHWFPWTTVQPQQLINKQLTNVERPL